MTEPRSWSLALRLQLLALYVQDVVVLSEIVALQVQNFVFVHLEVRSDHVQIVGGLLCLVAPSE